MSPVRIPSKSASALCRLATLIVLALPLCARGSTSQDQRTLEDRLRGLAEREPDLVRLDRPARSGGGRDIWLLDIGVGSDTARKGRPALLVVAGIEGNDLLGTSVAVAWIQQLVERYEEDDEMTRLLETTTIYVFPRLNPDAVERLFVKPLRESSANATPVDEDHDGLVDEDGPEDLNGDGLITRMRVRDGRGEYVLDPNDDRLMVEADPPEAEAGTWRFLRRPLE
jgi:hypothetical protein